MKKRLLPLALMLCMQTPSHASLNSSNDDMAIASGSSLALLSPMPTTVSAKDLYLGGFFLEKERKYYDTTNSVRNNACKSLLIMGYTRGIVNQGGHASADELPLPRDICKAICSFYAFYASPNKDVEIWWDQLLLELNGRSLLGVALTLTAKYLMGRYDDIVNLPVLNGRPPLLILARQGYLSWVQMFIESGAKIDQQSEEGDSALYAACDYEHLEVVKTLLKNGADMHLKNKQGNSPMSIVVEGYHGSKRGGYGDKKFKLTFLKEIIANEISNKKGVFSSTKYGIRIHKKRIIDLYGEKKGKKILNWLPQKKIILTKYDKKLGKKLYKPLYILATL